MSRFDRVGVHYDFSSDGAVLNAPSQVDVNIIRLRQASKGRLKRYREAKVRNFVTAYRGGRFMVCDTPSKVITPEIRRAFKKFGEYLNSEGCKYIGIFEFGKKSGYFHCHYLISRGFNYHNAISKWRSIIEPLFPELAGKRVYARAEEYKPKTIEKIIVVRRAFVRKNRILTPSEVRLSDELGRYCSKSITFELGSYCSKSLFDFSGKEFRSMVSSHGLEREPAFRAVKEFYSWMVPLSNLVYGYGYVNVKLLSEQLRLAFVETFRRLEGFNFEAASEASIHRVGVAAVKVLEFYAQSITYGSCTWSELNPLQKAGFQEFGNQFQILAEHDNYFKNYYECGADDFVLPKKKEVGQAVLPSLVSGDIPL